MKKALLCLLALLSAGCATTNEFSVAEYERSMDRKFPPIALFSKVARGDFERKCLAFDEESLLHHCRLNTVSFQEIYRELGSSGMFESVHVADDDVPYQLLVSSAVYNLEDAADIGKAAVAGATLMLAPLSTSLDIHIDAALTWHGHLLKRYRYEIPFTARANLFTVNQNGGRDQARAVVSRLIADFQKDEVLSPEFLYGALDASDYGRGLELPESVGSYSVSPLVLYPHPLHGVQARYVHRQFQFDYVDVFVYPIPSWEWEDLEKTQARESLRIRKEMEFAGKRGQWKDLDLGPDVRETWERGGEPVPVLNFSGAFAVADGERYETHTYLFVRKDKFIKVRASYSGEGRSRGEVEAFARDLLAGADVPGESLFMAGVRKNWRDSQP